MEAACLFAYHISHLSLPHCPTNGEQKECGWRFAAGSVFATKCKLMFLRTIIWRTPSEIYVHLNLPQLFDQWLEAMIFLQQQQLFLALLYAYIKAMMDQHNLGFKYTGIKSPFSLTPHLLPQILV